MLGHYIPQLANVIVEEDKKASKENYINFKGIMVCSYELSISLLPVPIAMSWAIAMPLQ